jgi:DNA polymerase III delta prime subunit
MAVAYLEEILNYDRKFPYMLIYGPSGTGKSEAMLLLYNMFGFEQVGENWADGTAYGIAMALNELSSMPFWMEEYKNQKGNSKKQDNKIQMLNNIYNRVGSGKGGLDGRQVQQVRGTLIFTGQDRPEDKAMLSRCVVIMKDAPAEKGSKSYFALTGMRENLSSIFLWAIRNKTAENKRKIVELIQEIKDEIDKKIKERPKDERVAVDARAIYNHCVLAAGWCMYGMKQYDSEFVTWLSEMIVADVKRKSTEDIIYKFFSEIELNFGTNSMYGHLNDVMVYREPGRLYLWMSKIYKVWVREANSMAEYISLDALTEYMRNDPHDYWIGKERAILRSASKNKQQRCICLDVNKLPNNLRDIADCWLPEITDEY